MANTRKMIKENKTISQYIFERKHHGTVNVLWFENDTAEMDFINFLQYTKDLRIAMADSKIQLKGFHFESTLDDGDQVDQLKATIKEKMEKGADILVLKTCSGVDERVYELLLSLKFDEKPSIFLMDKQISSTFITDKVICVDSNGGISDVFSPNIAEC